MAGGAASATTSGTAPERQPQPLITGGQIAAIIGSQLGHVIGGDNVFARVAAGSVLSSVLGSVGTTFDALVNDTTGTITLDTALAQGFNAFGANLFGAVQSQGVNAVSSYLTGELGQMLGVDGHAFGGQLFARPAAGKRSTRATTITSRTRMITVSACPRATRRCRLESGSSDDRAIARIGTERTLGRLAC